jgi:hypothetical protein
MAPRAIREAELEIMAARIWKDTFGVEAVRLRDNLLNLGTIPPTVADVPAKISSLATYLREAGGDGRNLRDWGRSGGRREARRCEPRELD